MASMLFLASWAVLMGFRTYGGLSRLLSSGRIRMLMVADCFMVVGHLVSGPRLPFTAAYFGSIALTLYFSIGVSCMSHHTAPTTTYKCPIDSQYVSHVAIGYRPVGLPDMVSCQLLPDGIYRAAICCSCRRWQNCSVDERLTRLDKGRRLSGLTHVHKMPKYRQRYRRVAYAVLNTAPLGIGFDARAVANLVCVWHPALQINAYPSRSAIEAPARKSKPMIGPDGSRRANAWSALVGKRPVFSASRRGR